MKAEEAKKKTENAILTNSNSLLDQVYAKIEEACQKGEFFCKIKELHPLINDKLVEDGFKVTFYPGDYRGETDAYYKISWE